jgi:organic radical activating enzyme
VASKAIDTERFSRELRARGVDLEQKRVLVTKFEGSSQAGDLTLPPNCGGLGRIHHFYSDQGEHWPSNPLPAAPASHKLGLTLGEPARAQVFQNAVCSWRCWYCFVDYELLSANPRHSEFKTADELLDLFLAEPNRPRIIDLSGGQPDLIPEWGAWFAQSLQERGLDREYFLWSDDNLSNDYLWRYLTDAQLELLKHYKNYGRVGCFKGFDELSFSFNTRADGSKFLDQFDLMHRIIRSGIDVYGYATLTGPSTRDIATLVRRFVDLLQEKVHPLFPLRTIPLRIRQFTPMAGRLSFDEVALAMSVQEEAVAAWKDELNDRFDEATRALAIHQHNLS